LETSTKENQWMVISGDLVAEMPNRILLRSTRHLEQFVHI
jgi:hypothetical protein